MNDELQCVTGCKHYYGGEIRHHKDCPFYPESMSKMLDDLTRTPSDDSLTIADYQEVLTDHRRLVRELDVALNGDGAAKQASLCDIVGQVKDKRWKLVASDVTDKADGGDKAAALNACDVIEHILAKTSDHKECLIANIQLIRAALQQTVSVSSNHTDSSDLVEIETMTEEMDRYIPDALLKKLRAYFLKHKAKG